MFYILCYHFSLVCFFYRKIYGNAKRNVQMTNFRNLGKSEGQIWQLKCSLNLFCKAWKEMMSSLGVWESRKFLSDVWMIDISKS